MGKDLKGKELGKGISQESTGLYSARFAEVWNIVTVQRSGVSENQRVNQVTVRYP